MLDRIYFNFIQGIEWHEVYYSVWKISTLICKYLQLFRRGLKEIRNRGWV